MATLKINKGTLFDNHSFNLYFYICAAYLQSIILGLFYHVYDFSTCNICEMYSDMVVWSSQ